MDRHYSNGRDMEEKERRRREWMRQQELEREHERLKKKKIEEWERKRRAEERLAKSNKGRSSYRSHSKSESHSPSRDRREDSHSGALKPSVMSQKFESSSNNTRLFKGAEGTKIDMQQLRQIKVAIHRKLSTPEVNTELQRNIVDPEDVIVTRREGEGAKPIFEREELEKPEVPLSEVEELRTIVAINNGRTERQTHSTRKRSATPTSSSKQYSHNSRREIDSRGSRGEHSRHSVGRVENHRSQKDDSDKDRMRYRSKERRDRPRTEDSRERRSQRRTSVQRDIGRDHRDRHERSRSPNRDSRRNESRSSTNRVSYREHRDRSRDNSRDRRSRDERTREMRVPLPHHYAETMQVPVYYEGFHPRPIMVGPMMPIRGQMPLGRGRMSAMMGPMRPPFPPRFMPHEMFRPLHPNPRFNRMF